MKVLYSIFILFILHSIIFSQDKDKVLIYADKKKFIYGQKYWDLLGNPVVKKGADTLSAKNIKYFQVAERAIAKGSVKIYNYKDSIEVFSKYGEYHTDSRYAKLVTDTKLVSIKDEITINSEIIERFTDKRIYTASNNVKVFLKRDNALIRGQKGVYSLDKNTITLTGKPFIDKDGWRYRAETVIFHTKTKLIVLDGKAILKKGNQEILANKIEYYSGHPKKKSVLIGSPRFIEYSDKGSFLEGAPYREILAKKVIFYNYDKGKAFFLGKAFITELFLKKESNSTDGKASIFVYKRRGVSDTIKYIGGKDKKVALIGDAKVYEPNKAAFADRIDYIDSKEKVIILKGNAYFYDFYKVSEDSASYSTNSVRLKGKADEIKYFSEEEKVILEGGANAFTADGDVKANKITYWGGNKEYAYAEGKAQVTSDDGVARADIIKYFRKEGKTILTGKARFNRKSLYGRAKLIEYYKKENKVLLKGDVLIVDGNEKKIISQDVVYKEEKGVETAILLGWSRLIKKNKVLAGNYIEYYKDKNKEKVFIKALASYKEFEVEGASGIRGEEKGIEGKKAVRWVFADQIIYYTIPKAGDKSDEKILLKSNIRIVDSKRTISGDNGEYYISNSGNGKSEKGTLQGNCEVIKKDTSQQAFSDIVEYFKGKDLSEKYLLKGNVEFNDKDRSTSSDEVTILADFKPNIDKIIFLGSPSFEDSDTFARGDRIEVLDGTINQTRIFGNVKFFNKKEFSEISSGYLLFDDDRDYVRVEKEPVFIQKEDDFIIYSNVIQSFRKTKVSIATGDVKAIQQSKTIYGEYLKYLGEEKKLWVTGNASLETKGNVTRAKKVTLNTKTKEAEIIGVRRSKLDPYSEPKRD